MTIFMLDVEIGSCDLLRVSFDMPVDFRAASTTSNGRFGSDGGVPLKPPNPYLSLRVILAEKGTHY